jgi:hypothetical protein
MDRATYIRTKVFEKLNGLTFGGVEIPIFDEYVNPSVTIPSVNGSNETYIIIQDQYEGYNETQTVCDPRFDLNLTIRVVTTWGNVASKKLCEDIANEVELLLRDSRSNTTIAGVKQVDLINAQSIAEYADSSISFSKILTLKFIKNG